MYICLCKGITDSQITSAVAGGATNLRQVRKALGVASQCGKCGIMTQEIINETLAMHTSSGTELYYAAAV